MKINTTIGKYIFITLLIISIILYAYYYISNEYKKYQEVSYDKIKNYLINDSSLAKSNKPILWIHNEYKMNDRNWLSFGSRNSNELNKPLIYITVDSIIKKCDKSFKICLIDDNSFNNLIPGWIYDLEKLPEPIRDNYRFIGMLKLIHLYGGMNIPSTFLCIKDLEEIYKNGTKNEKPFVGEQLSKQNDVDINLSNTFIGAPKENNVIEEMITNMEKLFLIDTTNESKFLDRIPKYLNMIKSNEEINTIDGEKLGLYDDESNLIDVHDMLSSNDNIELNDLAVGINIPLEEIMISKRYQWFSKLSPDEIVHSDTFIAKKIKELYNL